MHDRNQIKWVPFNSVINGKYIVNSIEKEKNKINKPILSEEQIYTYEEMIKESMINIIDLLFNIYSGGYIKEIKGTVLNINSTLNKILLSNNVTIFFCEIVKIRYLNY